MQEVGTLTDKTCVFPFIFNGVTYTGCTAEDDENETPWCATIVDDLGQYISSAGYYGYCEEEGCPVDKHDSRKIICYSNNITNYLSDKARSNSLAG